MLAPGDHCELLTKRATVPGEVGFFEWPFGMGSIPNDHPKKPTSLGTVARFVRSSQWSPEAKNLNLYTSDRC